MAPSKEGFTDPEGGIVHISEGLIKQNKKSCSFVSIGAVLLKLYKCVCQFWCTCFQPCAELLECLHSLDESIFSLPCSLSSLWMFETSHDGNIHTMETKNKSELFSRESVVEYLSAYHCLHFKYLLTVNSFNNNNLLWLCSLNELYPDPFRLFSRLLGQELSD